MKKIFYFISPVLLAILSFTCSKNKPIILDETQSVILPSNGPEIINANNHFAFAFFKATLAQDTLNNNKLISPLSIYLALSMVYNGADNATKDSIAQTLQLSGIDINNLNSVCQALISQLPKEDNKVQMNIANSVWYRQNSFPPLASFLDILQNNFQASAQGLNFNDPSSVNTINDWVSQKTNNKIPTIIQRIDPSDLMYLINAVYFNGSWQHGFKTSDTYNDNFYLQKGTTKSVPFMQQEIKANIFRDSTFSMVELPYGSGKSFSMYILKPSNQEESISGFASSLNENILTNAISKMDSSTVELQMPKWEYSYEVQDMRPELSMLGMGIAFGNNADFSKIYGTTPTNVYISKAIHKTYIKVDEVGTEAAAVTAIGFTTTAIQLSQVFKLDHPFLYAIIEKQTGAVLFLGMLNEP